MTSRIAEELLAAVVSDPDVCEAILGDLSEDSAAVEAQHGPRAARRWYWRQVIASLPRLAARSLCQASMSSWARAGLAAFGGYAAVVVVVIASDVFLSLAFSGAPADRMTSTAVASLVLSVIGGFWGGYVEAWIGKHAPYTSALALGLLFIIIAALTAGFELPKVQLWYYVLLQLSAVPSTLCGAALRQYRRSRSAREPAR